MRFVFKLDLVKSVITNSKYDMISTSMDFAGKNLKERKLGYYLTSGSEESSNKAIAESYEPALFFANREQARTVLSIRETMGVFKSVTVTKRLALPLSIKETMGLFRSVTVTKRLSLPLSIKETMRFFKSVALTK